VSGVDDIMHLLRPAGRTSSLQETKGGGVPAPMPAGPSLSHRQFGPKVNTGNYRNVEMVPTSDVRRYATQSLRYGPGSSEWDGLKSHVHEHGMEPGILEYNHKTGEAHLGEGNHRLALAEQQGLEPLPGAGAADVLGRRSAYTTQGRPERARVRQGRAEALGGRTRRE
jgi:hypothetical protein